MFGNAVILVTSTLVVTRVVNHVGVVRDAVTTVDCSTALASVELVVAVAATSQPRRLK